MTQEQKDQYNELEATAAVLREEVEQARNQVDHLNREKEEFQREISGSQVREFKTDQRKSANNLNGYIHKISLLDKNKSTGIT